MVASTTVATTLIPVPEPTTDFFCLTYKNMHRLVMVVFLYGAASSCEARAIRPSRIIFNMRHEGNMQHAEYYLEAELVVPSCLSMLQVSVLLVARALPVLFVSDPTKHKR